MGSNRISSEFRVTAYPVGALFSKTKQPKFRITDLPYEKGGQNWGRTLWPSEPGYGLDKYGGPLPDDLVGTMEPDPISKCCYARPFLVPHNNLISGNYGVFVDFNNALPAVHWGTNSMSNCWLYDKGYDARERYAAITGQFSGSTDPPPSVGGIYDISVTDTIKWQGCWLMVDQLPSTGIYGPNSPAPASYRGSTEVRFQLGSYDDTQLNPVDTADFVLVLNPTGHPELYRCWEVGFTQRELLQFMKPTSGALTTLIGNTKRDSDPGYGGSPNDITSTFPWFFEIRVLGGLLQIRSDSGEVPFSYLITDYLGDQFYNTNGDPVGYIRTFRVVMDDFIMSRMAVHPMKFLKQARQKSQIFTLGFVPQVSENVEVRDDPAQGGPYNGTPPGTSIYCTTDPEGTQTRYKVDIANDSDGAIYNGVEYSNTTHAYRAVEIWYPEVTTKQQAIPIQLYPETISITHEFNPNELEVTARATLTFCNFSTMNHLNFYDTTMPNAWWGQWANTAGAIAIQIETKLDWVDQIGYAGDTGWQTVFTGYANLQSRSQIMPGGQNRYIMECHSRDVALATMKWNLPWMDGWNHYYAAAYIAAQGGVRWGSAGASDLAFINYVPTDPFDPSPSLPPGEVDYFLPMGTGGSPLMSFTGGQTPRQVFSRFAKPRGYMRYFDVNGLFHYEKFAPEIPGAPYRTFQVRDGDLFAFEGTPAVAIFRGEVSRNLLEVRNKIAVIGVDAQGPLWNPIASLRTDEQSIDYTAGGPFQTAMDATVFNYVGFELGFVDMDSIFADPQFCSDAADGFYRVLRYPEIVGSFETWMQPDIFPGMWIAANEWKSGLSWSGFAGANSGEIPLLVMKITHTLALGQTPRSMIACRFVPNALS